MNTAQTGDWRREEEFTDVTLVEKGGTQERKGDGEYLGKEICIKCSGTGATETREVSTRRSKSSGDQEFRSSGTRSSRQGVADKGFIDKEFGAQGGVYKEFIGKDFVDKKSSPKRRST